MVRVNGAEALRRSWGSIAEPVPALFEARAAATPNHLAVWSGDQRLSYQDLNHAANRLARAILRTAPESDSVAVLIGHNASVVVAMLAVMKAGKAFVPIDTRQPPARMLQILRDSRAAVLVTNNGCLSTARQVTPARISLINVDTIAGDSDAENLRLPIDIERPACLLYTSGSTGSPKGVVLTHSNLLHRTVFYSDLFSIDERDRVTLLGALSVAQGVSSVLQALLNSASLHTFDLRELGIGELAAWLNEHDITVYVSTASTFRHFARTLTARDRFEALRIIRLGSEEISPQDFTLYRMHFPPTCTLYGTLGSTETGPVAVQTMDHESDVGDLVPAGYPIDGAVVRILDDSGRICGSGEVGEIVIRSPYVSPGYWNDSEKSAAAFVVLSGDGEAPYFRTGDLGRIRPDGRLEFKGRKSFRVKIRGFRVELGEIERALQDHPHVAEAAVIARSEKTGESRLTAFVVARSGHSLTSSGLRSDLGTVLPDQMVPRSYVFQASLPRTAVGKIDRAALAAVPVDVPEPAVREREPSDVVEVYLSNLWESLLDRRGISLTADFFELGGNSLLAARLSTAVERAFGTRLPLSTFFGAATIERQARLIHNRRSRTTWPSLVPIKSGGTKPPLFCVHLVDGNGLGYRELARHLTPDQPLYGLQSRGLDGLSRINTRIEDMARDYIDEIRRLWPHGPYAICGWSYGGFIAYEMARQLEQQGQTVALLALIDTHAPRQIRGTSAPGQSSQMAEMPTGLSISQRFQRAVWLGRRKVRNAKRLCKIAVWRRLILWQRHGGWLPEILKSVAQANSHARREYVPQPYGGRLTLFRASQRASLQSRDLLMGWQCFAAGPIETHPVPGTHDTMVFDPHVRALAEKLGRSLDKAWADVDRSTHQVA